jgi:KipI family sensor histidine kinase inhibitor
MNPQAQGDTAFLVTIEGEADAAMLAKVRAFAAALAADRLEGVTEIVPSYGSVGVCYEPERVTTARGELPWRVVAEWLERHLDGRGKAASRAARKARDHVVPVVYGGEHGPDLDAVARQASLGAEEVVRLHAGATYHVAALGFSPGFPYLLGLPAALATPRRTTPRLRVPGGSVGIGGTQTGIYPRETPGGWQLIGRTGLELWDPGREEGAALFAAGDRVRFRPVDDWVPAPAAQVVADVQAGPGPRGQIEVLKPGTLTTVQDLGRRGFASLGVGLGGALDPWAAAVANLAVGNAPEAPLLECTYVGPVLRFTADTVVAVAGAECAAVATGRPVPVRAGETLDCSSLTRGARLYLAVAGGLRVPRVLGGSGTVVGARFGGLGGRAMLAGDRLSIGDSGAPAAPGASWRLASPVPAPMRKETIEVRLVPGPDWARIFRRHGPGGAERAVQERRFQLSAKSDRMGLRLSGEPFTMPGGGEEPRSRPVVPGTVQLPPDGLPIVLMAEGQTVGGYPQLGQVATADLPRLAQARPGAEIVFKVVDLSTAQQARLRVAADLARLRVGLAMRR